MDKKNKPSTDISQESKNKDKSYTNTDRSESKSGVAGDQNYKKNNLNDEQSSGSGLQDKGQNGSYGTNKQNNYDQQGKYGQNGNNYENKGSKGKYEEDEENEKGSKGKCCNCCGSCKK